MIPPQTDTDLAFNAILVPKGYQSPAIINQEQGVGVGENDPINPLSGARPTHDERKVARLYGLVSLLAGLMAAGLVNFSMSNWGFSQPAIMLTSGLAFVFGWAYFQFQYFGD